VSSRGRSITIEPGGRGLPVSLLGAKDQLIPAKCEGIVMARLESSLRVWSGLAERSLQAHSHKGIYKPRTLVQDRREVPVRVLNATHHKQNSREDLLWHTVSQ
jgi:hypothetical protein